MRNLASGLVCGATEPLRQVAFLAPIRNHKSEQFGCVIDLKDLEELDFDSEPTLGDFAAYLRPGQTLKVGMDLFRKRALKRLAGEDGVEWWGWKVENKQPGVEEEYKWLFVAVQEVKE